MPVNLSIENAPDDVVERVRQRAELHRRSLQGELLAIIETAVLDERSPTLDELQITPTEALAEVRRLDSQTQREVSQLESEVTQLEEVLEQVRALPGERQQEVAQVLLAYLDEQNFDFGLSPEQIAEIERRAADDGPYATDEEVREVFARLTK
jgi:plasmid stability protein